MTEAIGERLEKIRTLEEARNSRVLVYFLGTREGLGTRMGMDAIRIFRDHLAEMGGCERLDLFLYTKGGDTHVPPRLAQLILEYVDEFNVLIPYRAHSAGTMLALAAKEIVMGPMGELGPVDPTTRNQFNPRPGTGSRSGSASRT